MDSIPVYRGVEVFSLHGLPRAIELDEDGLHHPRSARSRVRLFSRYADFTHLATSPRTLWLGTRRSTYVLPRRAFVDPNGPENLVRALLARIAQGAEGSARLARMAQVEETARTIRPLRALWGLTAACLVVYALQVLSGLEAYLAGYFSSDLVLDGDLWRVVTANLMHASAPHLVMNLLAILVFGMLMERPLGTSRTLAVIGASALGAMAASGGLDEGNVVGASGVALGLVGGVLWLELRRGEFLPAWWRIPRRLFLILLGLEAALNAIAAFVYPIIAWGAHVGGFVAGFVATAAITGAGIQREPRSPTWLRAVAVSVAAVAAFSLAAAAREGLSPDFIARHATRMVALPDISPRDLNNMAWFIAIAPDHTPSEVEAALRLAERAVAETGRENPDLLDTLAEVQFQLGWNDQAVATIEEAIARAPDEPYFREQRRRFLGERQPDDRPAAPLPWRPAPREVPHAPPEGVTV